MHIEIPNKFSAYLAATSNNKKKFNKRLILLKQYKPV